MPRQGNYADNEANRKLGRAGKSYGHSQSDEQRYYVDNALNRKRDCVGEPLGSTSAYMSNGKRNIQSALRRYEKDIKDKKQSVDIINNYRGETSTNETTDPEDKQTIVEMIQRLSKWQLQSEEKMKKYSQTSTSGCASTSASFENYKGADIQSDDIKLDEKDKIGHGGFGDIFADTWKDKPVAVKKLRVQTVSKERVSQFEDEVKVFSSLNHKNIIEFYGTCIKTTNLCIVMELMKCSLHDSIHQHEHQYTDEGKLYITSEIADGIDYLHSTRISHCDIKTTNILLDIFDKKQLFVKVADFGLNLMKNEAKSSLQVQGRGTPRYSAPEVLRGELFGVNGMQMADIYSYGLVLFELYSEEEPFEEKDLYQLITDVGSRSQIPPLHKVKGCGEQLIEIMRSCWEREPKSRPEMSQIRKDLSKIVIPETGVLIEV